MGDSDNGCGGTELCGANTELCSEATANSGSLLGASVDAEEEPGFGGNTENRHGAVGAGAADSIEPVSDGGHFFKGDANSTCGGPCRVAEVTDERNGGSGNHGVSWGEVSGFG